MTYETRQAYSEICAVLKYMPSEYVKKVPKRIIELFQTEKLENCNVNINKTNPIDKNYLSQKTMVIIAMLNYQYWCPNKKVKDDLYKQYLSNNENYQKEIEEKYSVDNLFKDTQKLIQEECKKENIVAMVKYKESSFTKLFKKIKSFFRK